MNYYICQVERTDPLYIFHQSKEECEYLIELAKPHMEKSTVVDSTTGKSKDSRLAYGMHLVLLLLWNLLVWLSVHQSFILCRVRTSSGMFLRRGRDEVIQVIEKRIADFTFIPVGMQFENQLSMKFILVTDIYSAACCLYC